MWIVTEHRMNGHALAGGQPTTSTRGKATSEPIRWITAVSSALSVLDFTRAFQLACSSAPNSTAATIVPSRVMQPRAIRSGSLPRQRIGFQVGETLHRFLHAFLVTQAGVLDAAEGRELE